jgi:hypothetical protein
VACSAERFENPPEREKHIRQVLVNSGLAAVLFEGVIPSRISREKLAAMSANYVLWRFQPTRIAAGLADPGGWFWIWPLAATLFIL